MLHGPILVSDEGIKVGIAFFEIDGYTVIFDVL
jgi:hypothetical protein